MKKFALPLLLCLWLALSVAAFAQAKPATPTSFAGTWSLNRTKTKDVPDTLQTYTLTVQQNEQRIGIETKVEGDMG
ncbi:MAG: hypothetical protein HOP19_24210, partial [Acidobacteria bacterium]|nr:hypothetical protein [Acidobacteriota bacterium]